MLIDSGRYGIGQSKALCYLNKCGNNFFATRPILYDVKMTLDQVGVEEIATMPTSNVLKKLN
jgi:hypothetical protein